MVRRTFGGGLDEIADPLLREVIRDAAERALRRPKRPIPADVLEMLMRLRQDGITMTLSACDARDLPEPVDVGISLTEAILEERYGRRE